MAFMTQTYLINSSNKALKKIKSNSILIENLTAQDCFEIQQHLNSILAILSTSKLNKYDNTYHHRFRPELAGQNPQEKEKRNSRVKAKTTAKKLTA